MGAMGMKGAVVSDSDSRAGTMQRTIDQFIAALAEEHGASANTLTAYHTDLRQLQDYLARRQGITSWGQVTPDHLRAFLDFLVAREYAPTSVARKLATTKTFFHHLTQRTGLENDPATTLSTPPVERQIPQSLDEREIARLFATVVGEDAASVRDAAMLQMLYATGMRVGEL